MADHSRMGARSTYSCFALKTSSGLATLASLSEEDDTTEIFDYIEY
jgi:hypothetical protein